MPTRPTLVIAATAWILLAGLGLPASLAAEAAPEPLPACKAADARADYGELVEIPARTKALIESYRLGWRSLCGGRGDGPATLHDLVAQALAIQDRFSAVFERESEIWKATEDRDVAWKRADAIHSLLSKGYPAFIPAFEGSLVEHEYFSPSTAAFRLHGRLGDDEDRRFLESGTPIVDSRDTYPWFEYTWDYGGCVRFGEFDWTGELEKLFALEQSLTRPAYLESVATYEKAMLEALNPWRNFCTCRRKESVLGDLSSVVEFLAGHPEYSSSAEPIQAKIDSIRAGEIEVRAEIEKHCSGG
jgi:hypothetical protein